MIRKSCKIASFQLLFSLLLGCSLNLFAQTQTLPFQYLSLGQGQDINMVYKIMQDKQGFMWFGTLDGLVRYDGYHFKHYPFDPETRYPMKGKRTNGLLESSSGNIWIISGQMLLSYHPKEEHFFPVLNLAGDSLIRYKNPALHSVFVQDSSGYLWLRSQRGLFKIRETPNATFEVEHFQHQEQDTFSLSGKAVRVLLYDSRHRLWIGTNKGLCRFDRQNNRIIRLQHEFKGTVTSLCETASGKICVGTSQAGLGVYDPDADSYTNYQPTTKTEHSIAGEWVRQLVRDGKGNIWLLSGSAKDRIMHLQQFAPESGEFHTYLSPLLPISISGGPASFLYVDHSGSLWVSTGMGLQRFDPDKEVFYQIKQRDNRLKDWSLLTNFYESTDGILWIGTVSRGVLKYAPSTDKFRYYPIENVDNTNLFRNLIKTIYEDSRGKLWVRTATGTDRFAFDEKDEPQKIATYPFYASFFLEDQQDRLWISTRDGLKGFGLNSEKHLPASTLPNSEGIKTLAIQDREGWFWSPSWGQGLKRYHPETGEVIHFTSSSKNPRSIGSNRTNPSMLEDTDGNIWICGANGLKQYHLKTGDFTNYLPGIETVSSLWENDSIMWVTTSGRGLYRFNIKTGQSKNYSPKNGFPTQRPISIFKDHRGYLWMSSDVGVIQFHPESENSGLFDQSDGLPSTVFSYGSCQRSNGEFFFPLWEGGFIRFHPDSLQNDTILPKPVIVDFRLLNQETHIKAEDSPLLQAIWATDHLTLKHHQKSFSLGFTAIHYAAPEQNQLLYKMEGINSNWMDPGLQQSVNFIGLPSGEYTFLLKAANHDGIWSAPISLTFSILPPWWNTWWAYLGYLLLATTAIYAFYVYKNRQWKLQAQLQMEHREAERLKELEAARTKLYTNITHEFRTPLTVILGLAQQLSNRSKQSINGKLQEGLKIIDRNGRNLLRLVNQMLDLSKLETGTLPIQLVQEDVITLLKYLIESFHSMAEIEKS
jgi:ligand-binding sensor domain-containing protein